MSIGPLDTNALKTFLPAYLTDPQKFRLAATLRGGLDDLPYFLSEHNHPDVDAMLQGDGWDGFVIYEPHPGHPRSVKGIVLSNSCDISLDNQRAMPRRVIFAPLFDLGRLEALLRQVGTQSEQSISDQLRAIRRQEATSYFYVPPIPSGSLGETVALLDHVQSMNLDDLMRSKQCTRIYSLSQAGFYVFLIKLTFHFARFGEDISRG